MLKENSNFMHLRITRESRGNPRGIPHSIIRQRSGPTTLRPGIRALRYEKFLTVSYRADKKENPLSYQY